MDNKIDVQTEKKNNNNITFYQVEITTVENVLKKVIMKIRNYKKNLFRFLLIYRLVFR